MKRIATAADAGARRAWTWRNKSSFGTRANETVPRLLVDVSTIIQHDARTGIQRVVRAVWSELAVRDGKGFVVRPVYANSRQGYCYAPQDFLDDRPRRLQSEPAAMGSGDMFLGLDLSAHVMPKYRPQLRSWRAHGASIHVVVYDLLPAQRPEWFNSAATAHFRKWLRLMSDEVDEAICISDQVAHDLIEQLSGAHCLRIRRLHMGGDIAASRPSVGISANVLQVLDRIRDRAAIMMVGTVEPRKGYEIALAAFELLWRADPAHAPDLVIVGKSGWKTAELQARLRSHPEFGRRLHWLDRVSDEGLCRFYQAARALLMTSQGEGFGLPLIEAAAHRRYVLARDLPVFREQQLDNVLFFSDDSPAALGQQLINLLDVSTRRRAPSPDLPTWSESVDRLLVEIGLQPEEDRESRPVLRRAS